MYRKILSLLALIASTQLTACIETVQPLCTQDNIVDIPGLDRTYVGTLAFFVDGLETSESQFKITRKAKGLYQFAQSIPGEQELSYEMITCRSGNLTLGERRNEFGGYEQNVLTMAEGRLSLNTLIIGQSALSTEGISFSIVEREIPEERRILFNALEIREEKNKYKVLVINNGSKKENSFLLRNMKTSLLGMTIE